MDLKMFKNYTSFADDKLVELIGKGDSKAFEQLFDRYAGKLLGYSKKILRNHERAEEAAQEVWIKVTRLAPQYQASGNFNAWVMTMTRNHCLNIIRKDSRLVFNENPEDLLSQPLVDDASTPESEFEFNSTLEHLSEALDSLPENQRIALTILFTEEPSYDELAAKLGVSLSALKSIVHRGRKSLQQFLTEEVL